MPRTRTRVAPVEDKDLRGIRESWESFRNDQMGPYVVGSVREIEGP